MQPTGEFPVGVSEFEWVADGFRVAPDVKLDPTKHIVGRLFYPCDPTKPAGSGRVRNTSPWLPSFHYATGYASFLFFLARSWKYALLKHIVRLSAYLLGRTTSQPFHRGAALSRGKAPRPVVVFSHGLGGCRNTYSIFCAELASHGYVVLALEHADGTASTCKLARTGGYRFYAGLGQEEAKWGKQRFRTAEAQTAARVLRAATAGARLGGAIALSGIHDPDGFLQGALDADRFAIAGHSFGGATCSELTAADGSFLCGIALDPWWYGLTPESAATKQWRTGSPLLIMGSHDWNTPGEGGKIKCGGEQQSAILVAARPRSEGSKRMGGGAMLLVLENSTHDTFNDIMPLFATRLGWLLNKMNFSVKLDPIKGMSAVTQSALRFLATHMPSAAASGGTAADALAADAALAKGLPQQGSDWSLVSSGSQEEAADAATPEMPSEATRAQRHSAASAGGNGSAQQQTTSAAVQTSSLDPAAGTESAANPVTGAQSQGTAHEQQPAVEQKPVKAAAAGGPAFSLMPSGAEVAALTGGRGGKQSGTGNSTAEKAAWEGGGIGDQHAGPEAQKVPFSKSEETEYRELVDSLAHIVEIHV